MNEEYINEIINFCDLDPEAFTSYKRVQYETYFCDKIDKEKVFYPLQNWLCFWTGDFLHHVFHHFKDIKKFNSALFCLYQSQAYQIEWIIYTLFSGHYDIVYRELRGLLENSFYQFYYDHDTIEKNNILETKLQKISDNSEDAYGKKVFLNSGYVNWNNVYSNIYIPLCKYIHTYAGAENSKRVSDEGFNTLLNPEFDLNKFQKSYDMLRQVLNIQIELMEIVLLDTYGIAEDYRTLWEEYYKY